MGTLDALLWGFGAYTGLLTLALGWLFKMIAAEKHDRQKDRETAREEAKEFESRLRQGISYPEAERMVDLKIQPLKESLDRNTKAVVHLTQVILERGLKVQE